MYLKIFSISFSPDKQVEISDRFKKYKYSQYEANFCHLDIFHTCFRFIWIWNTQIQHLTCNSSVYPIVLYLSLLAWSILWVLCAFQLGLCYIWEGLLVDVNITGMDTFSSQYKLVNMFDLRLVSDATVPFACAILVSLFTLQHYGTHKIGFIFTPVVILWLFFNGGVGFYNILVCNPHIFYAISPTYIYRFVRKIDNDSWSCFGRIVLCVAGWCWLNACMFHLSYVSFFMSSVL